MAFKDIYTKNKTQAAPVDYDALQKRVGSPYRVDPVSWNDYALQYDYIGSDDDTRKRLEDSFGLYNLNSYEAAGLGNARNLKSQLKVAIPNWTAAAEAYYKDNPDQRTNNQGGINESGVENPDGIITGGLKKFGQGFGRSFTDTVGGVGYLGNAIARNFDPNSEFGTDLAAAGTAGTDAVIDALKTNKEGYGYDVVTGLGTVTGMITGGLLTGGVGPLARGAGLVGNVAKAAGKTAAVTKLASKKASLEAANTASNAAISAQRLARVPVRPARPQPFISDAQKARFAQPGPPRPFVGPAAPPRPPIINAQAGLTPAAARLTPIQQGSNPNFFIPLADIAATDAGIAATAATGAKAAAKAATKSRRYAKLTKKAQNDAINKFSKYANVTGMLTSGSSQQLVEFMREYTEKLEAEGGTVDANTMNELAIASIGIGALDTIVPGKFMNSVYFKRAVDAVKKQPGLLRSVGRAAGLGVFEGGTEAAQKTAYNFIIADTLIDEDRDLFATAPYEGAVGGAVGFILGAVREAMTGGKKGGGSGPTTTAPDTAITGEQLTGQDAEIAAELAGLANRPDPDKPFAFVDQRQGRPTPSGADTGAAGLGPNTGNQRGRAPNRSSSERRAQFDPTQNVNSDGEVIITSLYDYTTLTPEQQKAVVDQLALTQGGLQRGTVQSAMYTKVGNLLTGRTQPINAYDVETMNNIITPIIEQVKTGQAPVAPVAPVVTGGPVTLSQLEKTRDSLQSRIAAINSDPYSTPQDRGASMSKLNGQLTDVEGQIRQQTPGPGAPPVVQLDPLTPEQIAASEAEVKALQDEGIAIYDLEIDGTVTPAESVGKRNKIMSDINAIRKSVADRTYGKTPEQIQKELATNGFDEDFFGGTVTPPPTPPPTPTDSPNLIPLNQSDIVTMTLMDTQEAIEGQIAELEAEIKALEKKNRNLNRSARARRNAGAAEYGKVAQQARKNELVVRKEQLAKVERLLDAYPQAIQLELGGEVTARIRIGEIETIIKEMQEKVIVASTLPDGNWKRVDLQHRYRIQIENQYNKKALFAELDSLREKYPDSDSGIAGPVSPDSRADILQEELTPLTPAGTLGTVGNKRAIQLFDPTTGELVETLIIAPGPGTVQQNPTLKPADEVTTDDIETVVNNQARPFRSSVETNPDNFDMTLPIMTDEQVAALTDEQIAAIPIKADLDVFSEEALNALEQDPNSVSPNLTDKQRQDAFKVALEAEVASLAGPEVDSSMFNKVRGSWSRWMASGGWLGVIQRGIKKAQDNPDIMTGPLDLAERFHSSLRQTDQAVSEGMTDVKNAMKKDFGKNVSSEHAQMIDYAMRGEKSNVEALALVAPETAKVIKQMRATIARNTVTIIQHLKREFARVTALTQPNSNLPPHTIQANMAIKGEIVKQIKLLAASQGRYVHRAYMFNMNPEFARNAKTDQSLQTDARRFIAVHYSATNPIREGQTKDDYNIEVASHVEAVIQDIFTRVGKNRLGSNVTNTDAILLAQIPSFKERSDVPVSIRRMLGEVRDPSVNFATTIQQQRLYLSSLQMAGDFLRLGKKYGWVSDKPDITKGLLNRVSDQGINPAIMLLSGSYMQPEMAQGLVDYFNIETQEGWLKHVNAVTGMVKLGKTVYSPPTGIRNFTSSLWQMGFNGTANPVEISKSFAIILNTLTNKDKSAEGRAYYDMLLQEGIVGDGISHQSLVQILKDLAVYDVATTDVFTATLNSENANQIRRGSALKSVASFQKFAIKMYQASDDFPKIIAFEHNRKLLAKALEMDINDPAIIKQAADRTRRTHFTYSKVNLAVKKLRGIPGSAPFISFPAEVLRTTWEIVKLMREDLTSGNAVLVRAAMLRGVSMTVTGVLTGTILQQVGQAFGIDDEKQENLKAMGGKFQAGTQSVFINDLGDGEYEMVNMSRYNPYGMFADAVDVFSKSSDEEMIRAITLAGYNMMEPFLEPDITIGVVAKAMIEMESDSASGLENKTERFLDTVWAGVKPTGVAKLMDIYNAYAGDKFDYGAGESSVSRELLKLAGATSSKYNVKTQLAYAGFAYSEIRSDMQKEVKRLSKNKKTTSFLNLKDVIATMEYKAQLEWGRLIVKKDLMSGYFGYSDKEIQDILSKTSAGTSRGGMLTGKEFSALMLNKPAPRLEYSERSVETAINLVENRTGSVAAAQVRAKLEEIRKKTGL